MALELVAERPGGVMDEVYNGMPATGLPGVAWRKSHRSSPSGECVEIACLPAGQVAVRNSRHPMGTVLIYTHAEMLAFVRGVKDGEFDDLLVLPLRPEGCQPARVAL